MVKRALFPALWLATGALVAIGCDSASPSNATADTSKVPRIATLSNRADLISGGDALVEITLPEGAKADQLHVTLGTTDVTSSFAVRANGRIIGLVTGLAEGPNVLSAGLGTGQGSYLRITNHKIGGPVISGPQVLPFSCATPAGSAESGNTPRTNPSGLSTMAIDSQCNIATEVRLFYRVDETKTPCDRAVNPDPVPFPATPPANACFKPYTPASPPSDLKMTTTDTGMTVPYIVRIERGTVNRGILDIAVLFDPSKDDVKAGWKPYAPQAGWNGKVVYTFGASSGQPRLQFHSEQRWDDDSALGLGFLVAMNSLTDSLYNSNRVLMTETLMMMKEKIIDSYGEVRYVMGNGCSGGSINQLTAASIYPGLLDGIQPSCTYPDSETTAIEVADCALLVNFYNSAAWQTLQAGKTVDEINPKKWAINGHLDQSGCHAWFNSFFNIGRPGNYVPTAVLNNDTGVVGPVPNAAKRNNCSLPLSMVYDPDTNPKGVRCSGADHAVAIFGTYDGSTAARSTSDNVGIQYGLKAFLSGKIAAEEFVTLNENIGGIDVAYNFTSTLTGPQAFARSVADPNALAIAYRAGIVGDGRHWAKIPMIDLRGWDEKGIHHMWRSFALRARLDAANGNHANHVMWRFQPGLTALQSSDPATSGLIVQSFLTMDKWLTGMKADTGSMALEAKVVAHRPAAAFDFCNKPIDATHSTQVTDFALCDADLTLQPHSSPRQVAGGPPSEDVLKCQLRPINRADYNPVGLTDAQFDRLSKVFKDGVCDFTKPGVGQQPAVSPLDFSAGPGGAPLPAAPEDKAF